MRSKAGMRPNASMTSESQRTARCTSDDRRSAGDVTLAGGAREPMFAEPAGRFASAIKSWNDLPTHIDDLAFGIDAQAGAGVVDDGGSPGGVEGRGGEFVEGMGLAEIL